MFSILYYPKPNIIKKLCKDSKNIWLHTFSMFSFDKFVFELEFTLNDVIAHGTVIFGFSSSLMGSVIRLVITITMQPVQ